MRSLLVAAVLVACGSHQAEHLPLPAPKLERMAEGPPLVTPGEHMSYKLALQGVELAVYDFAIGEVTQVSGKPAIQMQAHAKTVGLGALVKVDDFFWSWMDTATGRPLHWVTDEYTTDGQHKEKTDADLAARSGDTVPVSFHLDNDPAVPEPQHVSYADVWDYNSFLIALRSWEGAAGTTVVAEVFRSRYLWHVEMKIHGKDKLVTELGELPALRVDGHTYKLGRDGKRFPGADERDFSVWISDDDGRVPLKVVAKTDYGDVEMTIVDYNPGTGKRLRD